MKAGRVPALALGICALALVGATKFASAQCGGDPPTGSLVNIACDSELRAGATQIQSSTGLDAGLFIRFPLVSAVSWWIARQPMTLSSRNPFRAGSGGVAAQPAAIRKRTGF